MAFTATTLTGAVVVDQNTIAVASATGFVSGLLVLIDHEVMEVQDGYVSGLNIPVLRGREGSATTAHPTSARVIVGLSSDWANYDPQTVGAFPIAGWARKRVSISATGVIPLPTPGNDLDVFLNGTTVIAGTLANPTLDMDGCRLAIIGNGKAAHTVTNTSGLGNVGASADVITFSATQAGAITLIASGGFWNGLGMVVGSASVGGPGIG